MSPGRRRPPCRGGRTINSSPTTKSYSASGGRRSIAVCRGMIGFSSKSRRMLGRPEWCGAQQSWPAGLRGEGVSPPAGRAEGDHALICFKCRARGARLHDAHSVKSAPVALFKIAHLQDRGPSESGSAGLGFQKDHLPIRGSLRAFRLKVIGPRLVSREAFASLPNPVIRFEQAPNWLPYFKFPLRLRSRGPGPAAG